jgi:hypothetical protein
MVARRQQAKTGLDRRGAEISQPRHCELLVGEHEPDKLMPAQGSLRMAGGCDQRDGRSQHSPAVGIEAD